jgi:hypothetical protein
LVMGFISRLSADAKIALIFSSSAITESLLIDLSFMNSPSFD